LAFLRSPEVLKMKERAFAQQQRHERPAD
jgi:hypothetical protein